MENIGDDFGKQFAAFTKKVGAVLKRFPLIAANAGKNFFQDRFRDQAWYDTKYEPWAKRKPGAERDKGRAILTDRGTLKREVRIKQADWGAVVVGDDVKYAGAHNNGFKGVVTVPEHSRIATRTVATRYNKNGKASKTGRKRIRGASHVVRTHTRKMDLPKRQFIGNSALLNRLINRDFVNQLKMI